MPPQIPLDIRILVQIHEQAACVQDFVRLQLGGVHPHSCDLEISLLGRLLDRGRVVADPRGAEVEDAAFGREHGGVVVPQRNDCCVVDVGYEARGAVEGWVWVGVLAGEV